MRTINIIRVIYERNDEIFSILDSDLMYGPSNNDRRINDDLSNTLNDMNEDQKQIRYGYQATTASSPIENR